MRWTTPQGDHVHEVPHWSGPWPQSNGLQLCLHTNSLIERTVPAADILVVVGGRMERDCRAYWRNGSVWQSMKHMNKPKIYSVDESLVKYNPTINVDLP